MSILSVALLAAPCVAVGDHSRESSEPEPEPELGEAPDGEPGFGPGLRLHDIHALAQAGGPLRELLVRLAQLQREVRVFEALALGHARVRGQLELMRGGAATLGELHERWDDLARDPFARRLSLEEAHAAVAVLGDPALHMRRSVLERTAVDQLELRRALVLFHGAAKKRLALTDSGDVPRIALRADLAAARVRALVRDLERLYEAPAYAKKLEPAGYELDLVVALMEGDRESGPLLWQRSLRELFAEKRSRFTSLETSSLGARLRRELAERMKSRRRAAGLYRRALDWLPVSDRRQPPPLEIASVPREARYARARNECLAALRLDPFHPELAYVVGVTKERVAREEAEHYYDRFLLMRGVDWSHRDAWRGALDEFERYAFDYLSEAHMPFVAPLRRDGAVQRVAGVQSEHDDRDMVDRDRGRDDVPALRGGAGAGRVAGLRPRG